MDAPIKFRWDGEAMVPASARQAHLADERFVVGQYYALDEHHERSDASHAHYFATLHQIWLSLPERVEAQFPTAEHMRKHALIACGYADKRSIVCASAAEARRVAAFVAPSDTYAIVKVEAATVKARARGDAAAKRHLGITKPKHPMPGSRNSKWKRRMDGTVERRGTP